MNFKNQYQKAFRNAAPSPELQQETLELLREARDHHIKPEQPVKRWKLAYTVSLASAAAALFFCVVTVHFFSGDGQYFQDEMADEEWFSASDSFSEQESNTDQDNQLQEELISSPESNDMSNTAGSDSSMDSADKEAKKDYSDFKEKDESAEDVTDEGDTVAVRSKAPLLLDNETIRSYKSFAALLQALTDKTAPGYGKNYYLARELLIVPNQLPDGAQFRSVDLTIADGDYSYSYLLKENGTEFLLKLTVSGTAPKTLSELSARKESLAEEVVSMEKSGNTRTYLFGETEKVTLELEPILLTDPLPAETDVDRILSAFELERCSLTNTLLEMVY